MVSGLFYFLSGVKFSRPYGLCGFYNVGKTVTPKFRTPLSVSSYDIIAVTK